MNAVQRNFKRQQKQFQNENRHKWRKEHYIDHSNGKKYIRFYDERGYLMKTVEKKRPMHHALGCIGTVLLIAIIVGILIFVYEKFHLIIF